LAGAMFPQLFGKYVLEREIAAGGMARVYLATLRGAVGFEKRLVVKQIRPELASDDAFVQRFVDEAKTAVELNHPNIVPVYELGVEQGIYYLAMELCEGVTLAEMLNETGPLTPEEGAYVGVEICRALDYAHRRSGIVHRDVTPRNLMIDEEGAVRLIDFGIAAPVTLPDEAGTGEVELFGSPGHMPPEQLAGHALVPATDVFAVAVLLSEAWTGKPPFRRATPAECVEALRTEKPRVDAGKPELAPLADLVASAMALAPDDRPQTAESLSRPLREFVKSADLGDLARRLGARVRRTRRRQHASSPWLEGDGLTGPTQSDQTPPAGDKPRSPSIGDTQTFAVRNDLVAWTRKMPAPPPEVIMEAAPPSEALSTRRIAEEAEALSERSEEPLPATSNGERASRAPTRANRGLIAAAAVAVVAALAYGSTRMGASQDSGGTPRNTTSAPSEAPAPLVSTPPAPSATEAPLGSSPAPPASTHKRAPEPASSLPRVPLAPASGDASAEKVGRATLNLTAGPVPCQVSVAGRSYNTPAMGISLSPGSYAVSFFNSALGARANTSVALTAGATRTVYADFSLASPTVTTR
jgi:eukaryotic-like serine/threonine-protein kinase